MLRGYSRTADFHMDAAWEWRCRKYYGDRYDHLRNLVDWDYHMRLVSMPYSIPPQPLGGRSERTSQRVADMGRRSKSCATCLGTCRSNRVRIAAAVCVESTKGASTAE